MGTVKGAAEDELKRGLLLEVFGLGDALLEVVGFEGEEFFFEGVEECGSAIGRGRGKGLRCSDYRGFLGFAQKDAGGGDEQQSEAAENPPFVFGPDVAVAVGVERVIEAFAGELVVGGRDGSAVRRL